MVDENEKNQAYALEKIEEFEIDGTVYKACFDVDSLELGEARFNGNLFSVFSSMNMAASRVAFAFALERFHGELTYEQRVGLIAGRIALLYRVRTELLKHWVDSVPQSTGKDAAPEGGEGDAPVEEAAVGA